MSEKELWEKLRKGDKSALEEIYRSYFSHLNNYSRRFTNRDDIVEDSIQELFIELWERREKLSSTDNIKPYLLVSIRRKVIAKLKKSNKYISGEVEESNFDPEMTIEASLINAEISDEKRAELSKAMSSLSTRQLEIIYLKYYSNLGYDEIADIMELNYQSARNLLSRAIKKLANTMMVILLGFSLWNFNFHN